LDPAIVDEPGHDTNRIELKIDTFGFAAHHIERNTAIWVSRGG
jgi:hypothetical protein